MTTESSDTSKQCTSGDITKTKTGETALTMHLSYVLGQNFDPSSGSIVIDLPNRYYDYWNGADGTTSLIALSDATSMVDSSLLSVYLENSSFTFWASSIVLDDNQSTFPTSSSSVQSTKDTKITASFSTAGASVIVSGTTIDFYITGIMNPASTKPLDQFSIVLNGSDSSSSVVSLETCVYESEEGSATAVIGYDRVDGDCAIYRFRFKSMNAYPSTAGFKVTLPSALVHTTMDDYTLTVITGPS